MDKLNSMRCFCRISDLGSFSAAAREQGMPVSTLSRAMRALEAQLGAELLNRTTRHVSLTEIGRMYLDNCNSIIAELDRAENRISRYQSAPQGTLRISAMAMYVYVRLLPLLDELQTLYPAINLDLELTDAVTDLTRSDIDIAFRAGNKPTGRVIAHDIDTNTASLYASNDYLNKHPTLQHPEDLSHHKALLYRTPRRVLNWHYQSGTQWQPVLINPALISNSGHLLKHALLDGRGVGMFPRWALEKEIDNGEVQGLNLSGDISLTYGRATSVYMVYQRSQYGLPKIQAAVDFLLSRLKK